MAGVFCPYRMDNMDNALVIPIRVFAALQDKRLISERIPDFATFKDLLFAQPVSLGLVVPPPDTAVITVVFAIIAEFNQAAKIHGLPVMLVAQRRRLREESRRLVGVFGFDIVKNFFIIMYVYHCVSV
jgi:hypothetical protein